MSWPEPRAKGAEALPWNPAHLHGSVGFGSPIPTDAELAVLREDELQAARQDAFTAGERAGRERQLRESGQAVERALETLGAVTRECHTALEDWNRTLEENLVALAIAAARHIIEREVRQDPEVVTTLVRRALAAFPPDQRIRVRVHPDDLSAFSVGGPGGRSMVPQGREVEWIADTDIGVGGCMVEGPESVLDGRVDAALERLYWSLME